MSGLGDIAEAVLDPGRPSPRGLRTWNGSDPSVRLAVYRNNVVASLIDALGDTYPVVRALVGQEFFAAMAGTYLRGELPRSAVLAEYGAGLPAFIERFEPASNVPYLADVARLEYAFVQAYHAADADPLDPAALQALVGRPDELPGVRLRLHPSARLVASRFPIVSIWDAHQGGGDLTAIDPNRAESALIVRPELDVLVIPLTAAVLTFVSQFSTGGTLGEATGEVLREHPTFDLADTLTQLLRARALMPDAI